MPQELKECITARTVLVNDKNKILLLKINSSNGMCWITPGGKIEENETPLQAAQRELFEETGIVRAEFLTPHRWYCENILMLWGEQTLFKEHIFLAYTKESEVNQSHLNEDERKEIVGFEWWDIDNLKQKGETLHPHGLLELLDSESVSKRKKQ